MSNVNSITNEVRKFQGSVKKLSSSIKEAGVNWNDEKYRVLSKMVSQIASTSKSVIITADRLVSDVKRFDAVASQN